MAIKAEYIWIDGTEPTRGCARRRRSSTDRTPRTCRSGASTARAPTRRRATASDCVLQPVFSCPDPIRGGDNMLVMSEVLLTDMTPHPTNTRAAAATGRREVREPRAAVRHRAGVHVLQGRPAARLPRRRVPGAAGLLLLRRRRRRGVRPRHRRGAPRRVPRRRALGISGINAEVMPGQWEFQVGPLGPLDVVRPAVGRPLAALPHRRGLRRRGDARPEAGQGRLERCGRAHELLDEGDARGRTSPIITACEALGKKATEHVENYGSGIEPRLTGLHETAPWNEFSYGVSDRGASVRIPWQVEVDGRATSRTAGPTPTWTHTS